MARATTTTAIHSVDNKIECKHIHNNFFGNLLLFIYLHICLLIKFNSQIAHGVFWIRKRADGGTKSKLRELSKFYPPNTGWSQRAWMEGKSLSLEQSGTTHKVIFLIQKRIDFMFGNSLEGSLFLMTHRGLYSSYTPHSENLFGVYNNAMPLTDSDRLDSRSVSKLS